uniref:Hexosyltransferase n=1 Tax=Echinococcus granulosus TaxID=6210 RepID=A0A068WXS3_ECHGR|nr:beta 13 n galactosyltransferase [Echinococcus granulosus]
MRCSTLALKAAKWKCALSIITWVCVVYLLKAYAVNFNTVTADVWMNLINSHGTYCKWNENILWSPDGQYVLHLCYENLDNKHDLMTAIPTIEESKIRKNGSSRHLRFEELASIPDAEWLANFDRNVYQLYPQSIPIRDTLQALMNDKPILQAPIFNPRIRFLKVPSSICSPLTAARVTDGIIFGSSHPNVVIIYKSAVYNFKERNQIRKLYYLSYTDVNIHLIFSIGLPRTSLGNVFQRDGFNVTLQSKAGQRLLEHSRFPSRAKTQLIREMHKYNDLLVGDYEDSYFNLTLKQFHSFQWAARFCRPYKPTFVFLDDDFAVNTDKLVNFVRNKTPEQLESLNYGYKMNVNPVVRYPSEYPQWALSKREIPWPMHAPQYYGMYSLWSYRHVHDIALAMHFTKPLVLEDTWLGLVQHKLNLTFAKLIGMFSHNSLMSKQVRCSNIFFALISDLRLRHCIS